MNTNTTPAAVGSSAELGSLLDDWAEAAGHVWITRSGEQCTAWAVRRSDLEQLVCAYAAAEVARAVAAEREQCAKLCDSLSKWQDEPGRELQKANPAAACATAIRLRGAEQRS